MIQITLDPIKNHHRWRERLVEKLTKTIKIDHEVEDVHGVLYSKANHKDNPFHTEGWPTKGHMLSKTSSTFVGFMLEPMYHGSI